MEMATKEKILSWKTVYCCLLILGKISISRLFLATLNCLFKYHILLRKTKKTFAMHFIA